MKFTKNSVGGTIEILAADDFVAIPICVTETCLLYTSPSPRDA